jgi:hypothetical protein
MNMQEVRDLAKDFGIKTSRMSKMNLIQQIQLTEGNFNCFGSATIGECDQLTCSWRSDCFSVGKKLHS